MRKWFGSIVSRYLLYLASVKTIGKHINNAFSEDELIKNSTVANFATVKNEGGRKVERLNFEK